jgi:hypothetical protein
MSHEITHVVISLATPVQVAKVKTRGGIAGGALVLIGFVLGALLF